MSYLALEAQIYYDTNYHYPVRRQKVIKTFQKILFLSKKFGVFVLLFIYL